MFFCSCQATPPCLEGLARALSFAAPLMGPEAAEVVLALPYHVQVLYPLPALVKNCHAVLAKGPWLAGLPALAQDPRLLKKFLALPYSAVLEWLKSDDLKVKGCFLFECDSFSGVEVGGAGKRGLEFGDQT